MSESATHRLAALATGPVDGLTDGLCARAVATLVDTIGCAIAGVDEPVARLLGRTVADAGDGPRARVWLAGRTVGLADAAALNAAAAHALDFDDNMPTLRGHPSTTLWPAALAVGEAHGAGGRAMVEAYAVGLEVAGKLGLAFGAGHYTRGWHATSSIGVFGAAAAAGRLMGLDAPRMAVAFGLAASQMSGLLANFGTMAKPFHAAHAARAGVLSAALAANGFTANPALLDEGPRSVFASYRGDGGRPLDALLPAFGRPWEIERPGVYVKLWPCCYCSHRPIAGVLALLQRHGIRPDEIEAVEVGFPPGTDAGLLKGLPTTGLAGKFSVEYTLAALLVDGHIGLESFSDAAFAREPVQALMRKVRSHPVEDSRSFSSTIGYNDVAIVTRRGRFAMRVDETPGAPEPPMPDAQLDAKFLDCAAQRLPPARAQALLGLLRELPVLPDATALNDALAEP